MGRPVPKIELSLGLSGRVFKRWTQAGIVLRLDTLADAFSFTHVDKPQRAGPQAEEIADSINEGERVQIRVGKTTVLDGWVDTVHLEPDSNEGPMVKVQGRSATADLVDCAAIHQTGEWEDALFGDIAKQICDPFEIDVTEGDDGVGPEQLAEIQRRAGLKFRRASISSGEKAFDFLNRLAKERGLTLTTATRGRLAYTVAGSRKIVGRLEQGKNIGRGGSRTGDARNRFSSYRIFGQSAGDDAWHGERARGGDAVAEDAGVKRYRPFIGMSDGTASDGDYENEAIFQRNRRAARSRKAVIPILSWLDPQGSVWLPNRLIDVMWPKCRIEGEVLIESVQLSFDGEQGDQNGTLGAVHPGAYDPKQAPKTRANRRTWIDWSARP